MSILASPDHHQRHAGHGSRRRRSRRGTSVLGVAAVVLSLLALAPSASASPITGPRGAGATHAHIMKPHGRGATTGPAFDSTTDMTYHGGPVMRSVTNYLIFWDPTTKPSGYPGAMFDTNYRSIVDRYFNDIGGTPYFDILTQYGDSSGLPVPNATNFGGDWTDTTTFPHAGTNADPLQDSDIRASIDRAIAANPTWQAPGNSTMYYVYTGKNVVECQGSSCFAATDYLGNSGSNGAFCAYHWNNGSKIYAYIPYASTGSCYGDDSIWPNGQGVDVALDVTSHEQFEAYTDPFQDAWFDDVDKGAGENGDKCNFAYGPYEPDGTNIVLNGHPYQLQREWSNGSPHACVKRFGARPTTTITGDLSFGTVPRGSTSTKQITLQNTGNGDLDVLDAFLGSGTSSAVTLSPAAPNHTTLHAGDSALFNVTASPPANSVTSGPITGSLVIDTDDTVPNDTGAPTNSQLTATDTIAITATIGLPQVAATNVLPFGGVPTDNRTSPHAVTKGLVVANTGASDLTLQSMFLGGAHPGDYSIATTPARPLTIAPGSSVTIDITFDAQAPGERDATVSILTDDPANPSVMVTLTGAGLVPAIDLSPVQLAFGPTVIQSQAPGYAGATQDVTVTDTGQSELIVDGLSTSGAPFLAPGPTDPVARYAPSDHFVEPVTFAPTTAGRFTGTLTVADTDPEGGATASLPLCGEGVLRGVRVLVVDGSGQPYATVSRLRLQSHGTAQNINVNLSNLPLAPVTTSCDPSAQMQFEDQGLPTAWTVNQRSSYYTLSVMVGGKSTTTTFTLGASEFKVLVVTVK